MNDNKLIAEFMGVDIITLEQFLVGVQSTIAQIKIGRKDYICPMTEGYLLEHLQYHTSWDWLMPVVEKIETLGYTFEKNYQRVDKDWQSLIVKGNDILYQEFNTDSRIACHYVVVEFIKWHNLNK